MNNSNPPSYTITIRISNYFPGTKITVIDSEFNKLHSVVSDTLSVSLKRGLYQIRIDAIGYYQEEYIKVSKDQEFYMEMKSYSSIPVYPFKSTHEYYVYPAQQYSKESTFEKEKIKAPNFYFFLSNYERDIPGTDPPVAEEFFFFNDTKSVAIDFGPNNSFINKGDGLVIFSGHFEPGLYFLAHKAQEKEVSTAQTNKEEKGTRILPIYIFENYQTQFFLRYTTTPDFATSRIYFSNRMHFDHADGAYYALERLLLAFSNFDYYKNLTDEDHINIKESPYLKALVNILHTVLSKDAPHPQSEVLLLPDYKYLKDSKDVSLANELPMLSFIMFKYSGNDKGTIMAASVMDRVAEFLKYDIFWTSFTNIEGTAAIANAINKGFESLSAFDWITDYFLRTGILGSGKNVFKKDDRKWMMEKALHSFSVEDTKLLTNTVDNFVKKRSDVYLIAAKFNIPVTTVIRKYDELKKAYYELGRSESDLMKKDFFKKKTK